MISQKLEAAINTQINLELHSSYLYLSMSAWCESGNFSGFARWLRLQSDEEYAHAMKLFDLMNSLGATVVLEAIPAPEGAFGSNLGLFEKVLEHEKMVTRSINELYALSMAENAYPSQTVLQWFVDEQVEEVNTSEEIVHKLKLIKDDGVGLLAMDRELGSRGPEAAADGQ